MTVVVSVSGDENEVIALNKDKFISKEIEQIYTLPKDKKLKERPVVIGCGPAGMFAALILAQAGVRPILLERGLDVDSRRQKAAKFWRTGILDTQTNVQFGEMVKRIREKIISLGGEVRFNATMTELLLKDGQVKGVRFVEKGKDDEVFTDKVVLAIGHSAHDTFESLLNSGVYMEQKLFAVGVRVEHSQEMIDKIQYGDFAGHPALGAADYRMVVHLQNRRGVYTFCMCPGGKVVAATSEKNGLITNGMSEFARDGRNANTALLVTVEKKNLGSDYPLAGVAFQRRIEAVAFAAGGGGYKAPVQRLEDFLQKRQTKAFGDVLPTYLPGTEFAEADDYLPDYITNSLRQGIEEMDLWMPGFAYPDALLTGAETRSSSPVRITRGDSFEAIGIKGLYPCGEGAGYAGGIISAAVDGVLCAEQVLRS